MPFQTMRSINEKLRQHFIADESRDNALHQSLAQEAARLDAEREAILATDYPEAQANRANANAEKEAGWQRARAAVEQTRRSLAALSGSPAVVPRAAPVLPATPAPVLPSTAGTFDVDAFLAELDAKFGPIGSPT